jgi:hypothetical protein
MPLPHRTVGLSRYLAHDDLPAAMNDNDISIHTTEEMEKYESLSIESLLTLVSMM